MMRVEGISMGACHCANECVCISIECRLGVTLLQSLVRMVALLVLSWGRDGSQNLLSGCWVRYIFRGLSMSCFNPVVPCSVAAGFGWHCGVSCFAAVRPCWWCFGGEKIRVWC